MSTSGAVLLLSSLLAGWQLRSCSAGGCVPRAAVHLFLSLAHFRAGRVRDITYTRAQMFQNFQFRESNALCHSDYRMRHQRLPMALPLLPVALYACCAWLDTGPSRGIDAVVPMLLVLQWHSGGIIFWPTAVACVCLSLGSPRLWSLAGFAQCFCLVVGVHCAPACSSMHLMAVHMICSALELCQAQAPGLRVFPLTAVCCWLCRGWRVRPGHFCLLTSVVLLVAQEIVFT